jgi:RecA-family ATPase
VAEIIDDTKASALSSLDREGLFWKQQLDAALFKERIRREVKRVVEDEERAIHLGGDELPPVKIYDPLPMATPELIPGLMPEYGSMAIIGETNTGKSLIAIEIASALLTGDALWGQLKPNRTIGKVTFVLGEHTCSTLQGLYHRTQLPHTGEFCLIGPEHLHPYKALVIGGVQQQVAVDRLCKLCEGSQLIVFDPLAGFVQGMNAENDNATMRTLVDSMTLIASKVGAVSLILHHAGKPRMDEQGQEVRRTVYASRGASGIEDALTHIFYLRKGISVKQQAANIEKYDLAVRKFKGNPSDEVFKLHRDPVTKRNTLINTKPIMKEGPTLEEKLAIAAKVQRIMENNDKFSIDTAIKLVSDAEGYSKATIERWLGATAD